MSGFRASDSTEVRVIDFQARGADNFFLFNVRASPAFIASKYGLKEVLRRLLKHDKSNIDTRYGPNNMTPLMVACAEGHLEVVQILLENGANIDLRNSIGTTSLLFACAHRRLAIVKYLLEKGATVTTDNFGDTLLHAFANGGKEGTSLPAKKDLADLLLGLGIDRDDENQFGNTAIRIACQKGDKNAVEVLLNAGADVNQTNAHEETLLMTASAKNHAFVIRLLLQRGAKGDLVDSRRFTPFGLRAKWAVRSP